MKKTLLFTLMILLLCTLTACLPDDISKPLKEGSDELTAVSTEESTTESKSVTEDSSAGCQHSFGEWETVQSATCSAEGLLSRVCTLCEALETQTVPKSDLHSPVTDAAVPASCKSTGLTEGSHCSACNTTLTEQTVIPKTDNHKFLASQDYLSYECADCKLKAIEHGNADGSLSGGNNKVKYFVTGDLEQNKNFEIVIYGNGEMPNFTKNELPLWQDYLSQTVKITIGTGVTSIGKYAFYYPSSKTSCKLTMSDTVKTIKSNAISLKINNLVLGDGVELVESNGFGDVGAVYIPTSVKKLYLDALGNETYFYEGTLEEFYQIQLYVYNRNVTVKEYLSTLDDSFISNIHIYVQATSISDRSHYWR